MEVLPKETYSTHLGPLFFASPSLTISPGFHTPQSCARNTFRVVSAQRDTPLALPYT